MDGSYADGRSCDDIAHPMTVVQNPGHARCCRSCVCSYAEPWTSPAVFLVEDGGGHEGRGCVAGREGIVCAAVWSEAADGVFDSIDGCRDGRDR